MITKEHILQAKRDTIQIYDDLLSNFEEKLSVTLTRKSDHILVEHTEGVDDLLFSINKGKWHSVKEMRENLPKDQRPPEIRGTTYKIGNPSNINESFDVIVQKGSETAEDNIPAVKNPLDLPDDFIMTLWDSWNNGYQDFNTVKLESWGDAEEQYNSGKTVILSASHTWKEEVNGETVLESDHKWKRRLERIAGIVKDFDTDRYLIFLQDEPLGKSHWSLDDLNRLIEFARDILPTDAQIGMSFTNGSVNNRELPTGLNYYVTPNYPFKTEYAVSIGHKDVSTKQEFDEDFDGIISRYRNKIGDKDIHIIGQGFYNTGGEGDKRHERRWAKPPLKYVQWLIEACARNNIKGAWWWVYQIKRNHYEGLNQMPKFYEEVKKVYEYVSS